MSADDINGRMEKPEDVFDFIVRRALETDNHPNTATKIALRRTKNTREEKQKWLEYCKEQLKQEDPIERYCYDIRGIVPEYDLSFEEHLKDEQEAANIRQRNQQKFDNEIEEETTGFYRVKPEGMTKKQWIEEKRKRTQLRREERNQEEADRTLELQSPIHLFGHTVDKIGCECKAEEMRRGIFCDTCKLIGRVKEYMLNLFKNTSQKRAAL
jgi:hypothetical protein